MTFELTVLGSSSALPTSTKYPAAHVLNIHERFFLIDCGEGAQIQLRKSGIGFGKINHIFISHMHGDHVFGLFGLLSTFDLLGRKYPLHIYGPRDLSHLIEYYHTNFSAESNYEIKLHFIEKRTEQIIYEDKIVEVTAFPLKHRVPCFGYLFREKERPLNIRKDVVKDYNLNYRQITDIKSGIDLELEDGRKVANSRLTQPPFKPRAFAYCSDTALYEKNIEILSGVDLLYHEATFMDADKKLAKLTGHSTTVQAATMAKKSRAAQLLIGHFSSRYKNEDELLDEARGIFPETQIAMELKSYSIEQSRLI